MIKGINKEKVRDQWNKQTKTEHNGTIYKFTKAKVGIGREDWQTSGTPNQEKRQNEQY